MRRQALVVLALLALLAAGLVRVADVSGARILRVVDARSMGPHEPLGEWSSKRPALADADGDGALEIVSQNGNGRLYVLDPRTGAALAELAPSYPYGPDLGPFNGPRAADLDGDGRVEIVNVNRAAVVSAWTVEGRDDGRLRTRLLWERHLDDFRHAPSADAGPVLGDLDGDGDLEIVVQTEERGAFALSHDGSTHWALKEGGGNAEAKVADVDGDGDLDAVFFTDGGAAYAVDGPTGVILWRFQAKSHGVWPGSVASPGLVEDLDGDGSVEVVFCARNVENATVARAPGAPGYREHHFALFAARDGRLLWKAKPSWGNPLCSAYLAAFDAPPPPQRALSTALFGRRAASAGAAAEPPAGDGRKEIFGLDWNTIGHKPGDWERTGPANAFAFDADGRPLWRVPLDHPSSKPSIAIADWDGDGRQDVIAYARSALVVLDPASGERTERFPLSGWVVKQGPLLADLDGDGALDAVVAGRGRSNAFLVVTTDARSASPAWPGWESPQRPPDAPRARVPVPQIAPPAREPPAASAAAPRGNGTATEPPSPQEPGSRAPPAQAGEAGTPPTAAPGPSPVRERGIPSAGGAAAALALALAGVAGGKEARRPGAGQSRQIPMVEGLPIGADG